MRTGYFRAALAGLLFVVLALPPGQLGALRAQQQNPPQKPPVSVPAPPQGNAPGQKTPQDQKAPQDQFSYSVEVPLVRLDVIVADIHGNPITGLKKAHFKVSEDGVTQQVTNFAPSEAPITTVLLFEFSRRAYGFFAANAVTWADEFTRQLKQDDWIALVSFDMRTRVEVDFTRDKLAVRSYLARMAFPGFSESNVFDALLEVLDRIKDVKGRKSILLLASGVDTFSKHTLDDMLKRAKEADASIFCVGVARAIVNYLDNRGQLSGPTRLDYYQAENQMNEFSRLTGGRAYFPQFQGEIPGIMQEVASLLRSQYSLGYTPSNQARDGKYRKIKVDLVAPDGGPLTVNDQKGKKLKIVVYNRQGYTASKGGVSD
jgi:VWFA-related protein